MPNTTTVIPSVVTFATGASGAFTDVTGAGQLPTFTDAGGDVYFSQEFVLEAGGVAHNPPGFPNTGVEVAMRLMQITNIDPTGYVALSLSPTAEGASAILAPNGGMFVLTSTGVLPEDSGSVFDNGSIQLRTCDAAGILANGTATRLRITCVGKVQ